MPVRHDHPLPDPGEWPITEDPIFTYAPGKDALVETVAPVVHAHHYLGAYYGRTHITGSWFGYSDGSGEQAWSPNTTSNSYVEVFTHPLIMRPQMHTLRLIFKLYFTGAATGTIKFDVSGYNTREVEVVAAGAGFSDLQLSTLWLGGIPAAQPGGLLLSLVTSLKTTANRVTITNLTVHDERLDAVIGMQLR